MQLPREIIDIIIDFNDYEKYCKPNHKDILLNVLNDIEEMGTSMKIIFPSTAWQLWGNAPLQ